MEGVDCQTASGRHVSPLMFYHDPVVNNLYTDRTK